jgi:hypothetical protein
MGREHLAEAVDSGGRSTTKPQDKLAADDHWALTGDN